MAVADVTISDAEYGMMMGVLNTMRSKLAPLKVPLTRMMASDSDKVKAFVATDNGRFLREVYRVRTDLNDFFDAIGWQDE